MERVDLAVVVKPMLQRHIPAVMEIERESFSSPWPDAAYRKDLSGNKMAYYVVVCPQMPAPVPPGGLAPDVAGADEIWACGGLWIVVDEAHIMTLATRRDLRRRGLAEVVLVALLSEAKRRRARCATLEVRASNAAAQGLYGKYGFEVVGRRKGYYPDNREDALIMTTPSFLYLDFLRCVAANFERLTRRLSVAGCEIWTEC